MTESPLPVRRNFYGRVHGKTLRAQQKADLETGLAALSLTGVTREENPGRTALDLSVTGGRPLWPGRSATG